MNEKQEQSTGQRKHLGEPSAEVVNLLWIGPPKYTQGGQDVLGALSISENFKQFGQKNPLIFWCQAQYKEDYIRFFAKENVSIQVNSIEEYLTRLAEEGGEEYVRIKAAAVLQIYNKLKSRSDDPDIQIKDRVRIKNLFSFFLAACEGGYVLDSNVCAATGLEAKFPSYEQFHFPWIRGAYAELWMFYSPKENSTRARYTLNAAVTAYQEQSSVNGNYGTSNIALFWLTLKHPSRKKDNKENIWNSNYLKSSCNYVVEGLNLFKEYYNSHYVNRHKKYSVYHLHAMVGDVGKVEKDLRYGIDPNLTANTEKKFSDCNHDTRGETLLNTVIRCLRPGAKESLYLECARLYLENGADPDALYTYASYDAEGKQKPMLSRSPLFDAIHHRSIKALILLCDHKANVSQPVNGIPLLTYAVVCNFKEGVEELLRRGANPNQFLMLFRFPLYRALKDDKPEIATLLLECGAKIELLTIDFKLSEACAEVLRKFKEIDSLQQTGPRFFTPLIEPESGEKEVERDVVQISNP